MTSTAGGRELDIVVYGATGFVGRLLAGHLASRAPAQVRIGLAGRALDRLAAVRDELGARAAGWPLLEADAGDAAALAGLAGRTRVLASTVGPYLRHGLPVVGACARAGTDYVDLTGELSFTRASIDRYDHVARGSGARVVHSCGFDSVPSDLAVLLLAAQARSEGAGELGDTVLLLRSIRGGLSGGTLDSARTVVKGLRTDRRVRRLLRDPYALSPDRAAEPEEVAVADQVLPRRDPLVGTWTAPFPMAVYNSRVVRRSNALQGWAYGRGLRYHEAVALGRSPVSPLLAGGLAAGMAAGAAGLALAPDGVLDRVLPAPGSGPGERTRRSGHFRVDVHTRTAQGARFRAVVAAQGDPGYAATSVMIGESALALVLERDRLPGRAGVLTPAAGIGMALVERLRAAGFRLSVGPVAPVS